MGGISYITAMLMASVAFGSSGYVYVMMGRKENVTSQDLVPLLVMVITTGVGFLVALLNTLAYYAYYRDDLKAWREERRKQSGPQLHTLLDRINGEQSNFDKLSEGNLSKNGFSQYTEITPFELLVKDLEPVSDLWGYRRLAKLLFVEIIRIQAMPCGKKDVACFMPLLKKLQAKLEMDVKGRAKNLR